MPCTILHAWGAAVNKMPTSLLYIPLGRDTTIHLSKKYNRLIGIGGLEKNIAGNVGGGGERGGIGCARNRGCGLEK